LDLAANVKASGAPPSVQVKVLDWGDLDFTLSIQRRGAAHILLMSDVVYFPMLWKPLVHTILAISTSETVVYWANCDKYPHFRPDMVNFLELVKEFFHINIEEERSQVGCGGPSEVEDGRVVIRSLKLIDENAAQDEVDRAMAKSCVRRCFV